jgi:hypothetical protein
MALAIRLDQLLRDGTVSSQAELANLGRVSPARLTQIMNLLNLAPKIQDEILCMAAPTSGRSKITERRLRRIANLLSWDSQRQLWSTLS